MRIYADCYELISEMYRDLHEMGIVRLPKSYQNKKIEGVDGFRTKEITHYVYRLMTLEKVGYLFMNDMSAIEWAEAEFRERMDSNFVNPGRAWKLRPHVWEQFLNPQGMFDYTYNQRIDPDGNLNIIIEELKDNPDSRQLWLPIFWPKDNRYMGGTRRIPCSLGYWFNTEDGKLCITYIQRSADAVTHLGNDIFLAWKLLETVAFLANIPMGYLNHHIFSLHVYEKDWKKLEDGISNFNSSK
jgi:thymidylate synthase